MLLHSKEPSTRNLMETIGTKHEGSCRCIGCIHLVFSVKTENQTQRRTKMHALYILQLEKTVTSQDNVMLNMQRKIKPILSIAQ